MTAFASSEEKIDSLTINCELRSVNHRYCDITVKLPEPLRFLEATIRSTLSSQLKRGKIECSLSLKKQAHDAPPSFTINDAAVKALLHATASIEQHMHTQQSFSALEVLSFPGIQQETEINKKSIQQGVNKTLEAILKKTIIAKESEGAQLAIRVKERCDDILVLIEAAKKRLPSVLEQIKIKIKNRILELEIEPDYDRLEQEMVFLTQKLDVAEELDRLEIHVQETLNTLLKNEAIGRRLDFMMQEMNREANTLGSKSTDKEMTQISIDLKVLIEQMREQIQNIE